MLIMTSYTLDRGVAHACDFFHEATSDRPKPAAYGNGSPLLFQMLRNRTNVGSENSC